MRQHLLQMCVYQTCNPKLYTSDRIKLENEINYCKYE